MDYEKKEKQEKSGKRNKDEKKVKSSLKTSVSKLERIRCGLNQFFDNIKVNQTRS